MNLQLEESEKRPGLPRPDKLCLCSWTPPSSRLEDFCAGHRVQPHHPFCVCPSRRSFLLHPSTLITSLSPFFWQSPLDPSGQALQEQLSVWCWLLRHYLDLLHCQVQEGVLIPHPNEALGAFAAHARAQAPIELHHHQLVQDRSNVIRQPSGLDLLIGLDLGKQTNKHTTQRKKISSQVFGKKSLSPKNFQNLQCGDKTHIYSHAL